MFNDVNKVTLIGNITSDPDLRFTNSGSAVLNFGLATNRSYKLNEEWKDEVTFHNIVLWKSAESLAKRIRKGTRIYIEGRLQTRSWEGNDGQTKYKTEVVADTVSLISRYEAGELSSATSGSSSTNERDNTPEDSKDTDFIDPKDLPF